MRLVTYEVNGSMAPGVLHDDWVYDIGAIPGCNARSMLALISQGEAACEAVDKALRQGSLKGWPQKDVRVAAPIPRPAKNVFCVGRNYIEHAKEQGAAPPEFPVFFTKAPNTVIGPGEPIVRHMVTQQLDYEAELAVVIGKAGRDIKRADAMTHVFGYTIINDVTARDLQKRHQQWFKGKSLDSSCPMGPAIVTVDEISDPQGLDVRLWVNNELRQTANTEEMIFDIATLIEWLSMGYTLEPGDVIATGTPSGVGAGCKPPRFLQPGDQVEIEISGIGRLCNPVHDWTTKVI